jgi:predicted deacylase
MHGSDRHRRERVPLARLPSGRVVTTTMHRYGPTHGPSVYVQAAQHGSEVNGTAVCRRLHDRLRDRTLLGEVTVVPVVDPLTFDRVSYTTSESLDGVNPNMNRVWPGDADGTLHERMAATLWGVASEADAVLDLHTGSPDVLSHVVYTADDAGSRRLARAFGTDLLLAEKAGEAAPAAWNRRGFGRKFRVAAAREDVPAITPELRHDKRILEDAVGTGVGGVLNVLRAVGVLPGEPPDRDPPIVHDYLGTVDAVDSGLFRPASDLELGDRLAEGRYLGTLYDPTTYETLQEVQAGNDGILYALTEEATVTAGDRLAGVGLVDGPSD